MSKSMPSLNPGPYPTFQPSPNPISSPLPLVPTFHAHQFPSFLNVLCSCTFMPLTHPRLFLNDLLLFQSLNGEFLTILTDQSPVSSLRNIPGLFRRGWTSALELPIVSMIRPPSINQPLFNISTQPTAKCKITDCSLCIFLILIFTSSTSHNTH